MTTREQNIKRWIVIASVLLVLLTIGIAAILWSESRKKNALINEQLDQRLAIHRLEIKRPGKVDIKLKAANNSWIIHEPCTITVNEKRLQPLLSIATPAAFSYTATEVDLEAAGLINPLATVVANTQRIDIGNTDLSGDRRYIKRGERVEFIPEWILPLLEGGLSALSELALFTGKISTVTIDTLDSDQSDITQDSETWQQLNAQQIVPWPILENVDTSVNAALKPQYSVTIETDTRKRHLQVYRTAAFAAVVFENSHCAYLLPKDALDIVTQ